MYYGNGKATPADNAAQTYDADQTLIWHFGEHNAPPRDMTAYANNATSPDRTAEGSLIATGAKFDGTTPIALPASASLAIEDGGQLSWSAWLKPDDVSGDQMLYVQRDGANALAIGVTQGVAYASAGAVRLDAPAAFEVGKWHHLTVTAGDALTLYVDGVAVKSAAARLPHLATAPSLGGEAGATSGGFKGELDELEIAKTARSAAFVKALYAGQGPEQALVKYGEDEQNSSWSSGYFGIILRSVTLDGWVIIGILLVMAAISWVVMATKTQYIQQVGRGNQAFLEIYKEVRGDLPALHRFLLDKNDRNNAARRNRAIGSPLARVFSAGIEELHIRVDPEARPGQGLCVLADQSIHAIRASIDAVVVREDQRLNSLLVLLTIAISGGPFIGLLGTVVGVMITFAAIAAAGDVNVNAIAPGIAAALVATVAGLFVAIPALFGYNYLLSRVKEISSDIDVFVDRFITRLAESYRSPDALTDMAAE
jgi:biopolymer transport protein ExbB